MAHDHDAAHVTADDEYLDTPEGSGHEHTDANVWIIVQFATWLLAAALVTHVLMWGMFRLFVTSTTSVAPVEFPLAKDQAPRLPAGPRLQPIPANEIFEFRQREDAELTEYAWVDRNAGTVRIPIEQAKQLLLQRGLPSRAQAAAPPEGAADAEAAVMMPADSSAGRTMERRR